MINFPTSLDTLTNPITTNPLNSPSHAGQHSDINDAVEALEAKVGADSSAVNTSHDYKITQVENKTTTPPTDLKISTASKGGLLRNIDGAVGDTTVTTATWVEDEKFGFYNGADANNNYAVFASSPTGTGRLVLKFGNTNTTGRTHIDTTAAVGAAILASNSHNILPAKPSTTYKFTYLYQTVTRTSATLCQFMEYSGLTRLGFINGNAAVVGTTNGWTRETIIFTTNASTDGLVLRFINAAGAVEDNIIDVNSMTLTEYKPDTTFTGKVAEKIRPVLQAVTSTDNIDQSLDPTGAYTNTYALTNAVNEGATHIQTFQPGKKYITRVGVWVVAKGTGNWTLAVHDASNNVLASKLIANASLTNGAFNYFDVPNIWASGNLHFHLYSSVADGTCKANTSNDLETASYIQNYAKKTENFTLISNGVKTDLKADKDGLLSNAIIDLDNGKYRYYKCLTALTGTSFPIAISGDNEKFRTDLYSISGQYIGTNYPSLVFTSGYNTPMVLKVNTILPSKNINLKLLCSAASDRYYDVHYSLDNINWVALSVATNANDVQLNYNFNVNQPTFFVRIQDSSGSSKYLKGISIEADLDTSSIPQGLFYPIGVNQFAETWKATGTVLSYVYRKATYTNEYGVVMPAIELNSAADGTGTDLGYIPLKIDNSQETTPAITILSSSGVASDTVLDADGEYVALSSGATEGSVNYQVTITKNTLYLSSNAESVDSTQDPSHQGNFIVGVKQQGLTDRVKDIGEETEDIKKGLADNKEYVRNNTQIIGFDAGTTDDYAITWQDFTGYKAGMSVIFRANTANTGGATLNINGMGAKAIVKGVSTALATNDILALMYCHLVYDGTNFVLLNPRAL